MDLLSLNRDALICIYRICNLPTQFMFRLAAKKVYRITQSIHITSIIEFCVQFGYLNLLKWLDCRNCKKIIDSQIYCWSARYDQLDILKWIHCKITINPIYISSLTISTAIGGNPDMIEWVCNNIRIGSHDRYFSGMFEIAIINGKINTLRALRNIGIKPDRKLRNIARMNNKPELLAWLIENGYQ